MAGKAKCCGNFFISNIFSVFGGHYTTSEANIIEKNCREFANFKACFAGFQYGKEELTEIQTDY
jgi:hypothetical protein